MASRRSVLFCIFFLWALCPSAQAQRCMSHVPRQCSGIVSSAPRRATCRGEYSSGFSVCLKCTETTSCQYSCYERVAAQAAYLRRCSNAPKASYVLKAFMTCVPTCMKLRYALRKQNAKRKFEGKIFATITIGTQENSASWLYTPANGRCTIPLAEIPISVPHHYGFSSVVPEGPRKGNRERDGGSDDDSSVGEELRFNVIDGR